MFNLGQAIRDLLLPSFNFTTILGVLFIIGAVIILLRAPKGVPLIRTLATVLLIVGAVYIVLPSLLEDLFSNALTSTITISLILLSIWGYVLFSGKYEIGGSKN